MKPDEGAMREERQEVSWALGATTVYGTLVRPSGPGPFPAVVLVAGSGPTDRDWNSPLLSGTNGSARLLAEVGPSRDRLAPVRQAGLRAACPRNPGGRQDV